MKTQALIRSQKFFLFKQSGQQFLAVSLLAQAQGVEFAVDAPMIAKFLDPTDAIAPARPLLSGNEIMQQLDIKPGKQLGQIIKAVEQAQAEGVIEDKQGAIAWLKASPSLCS